MFKPLLILMLAAAQLFAGRGVGLFVCLGQDGSFCCVDSGPDSCGCCANSGLPPCESTASHQGCSAQAAPGYGAHAEEDGGRGDDESQMQLPCDCIHIPLLIAAHSPTTAVRPVLAADSIRPVFCNGTATVQEGGNSLSSVRYFCSGEPPIGSEFLSVALSTVVIRC
jgi:hypothetical protein